MHKASACAAGFYFPDNIREKASQMTHDHDNSVEAKPIPDVAWHDTPSDQLHAAVTAELVLLEMLARLILDAAERIAAPTMENDP